MTITNKSKPYHKQRSIREWIARPLYYLPEMPAPLEKFLVLKIIMPIEGKTPHWKHLGKKCPCLDYNIGDKTS